MNSCEHCDNNTPHLHFYIVSRQPEFSSFDDAYTSVKNDMTEYYNGEGNHGFLSECLSDDYLNNSNIIAKAKQAWETDQSGIAIKRAACVHISELTHITELPDFIKFLA